MLAEFVRKYPGLCGIKNSDCKGLCTAQCITLASVILKSYISQRCSMNCELDFVQFL